MSGLLSRLLSARKSTARSKSALASGRAKPRVEGLEDRFLLSAYSLLRSPIAAGQYAYLNIVNYVPNLQGVDFYLVSSNGSPAHHLVIQTECWSADGSATITGTWSGGKVHAGTGTLSYDAQGNLVISFTWSGGAGQNTLTGVITHNNSPYVFGPQWHLEGDVNASGPGGGPGHVSGNSQSPFIYFAPAWF
jgi:hypothetical protein